MDLATIKTKRFKEGTRGSLFVDFLVFTPDIDGYFEDQAGMARTWREFVANCDLSDEFFPTSKQRRVSKTPEDFVSYMSLLGWERWSLINQARRKNGFGQFDLKRLGAVFSERWVDARSAKG